MKKKNVKLKSLGEATDIFPVKFEKNSIGDLKCTVHESIGDDDRILLRIEKGKMMVYKIQD